MYVGRACMSVVHVYRSCMYVGRACMSFVHVCMYVCI